MWVIRNSLHSPKNQLVHRHVNYVCAFNFQIYRVSTVFTYTNDSPILLQVAMCRVHKRCCKHGVKVLVLYSQLTLAGFDICGHRHVQSNWRMRCTAVAPTRVHRAIVYARYSGPVKPCADRSILVSPLFEYPSICCYKFNARSTQHVKYTGGIWGI